jgi:excinuclease ABC subunit B
VSLVAILDADKEGFLRSPRSLIQTIGRAARNVNGHVLMYADRETDAMRQAIGETDRRRALQKAYNDAHGITPATIKRAIFDMNPASGTTDYYAVPRKRADAAHAAATGGDASDTDLAERIQALRQEMFAAAENLQFETAARLRDELKKLQALDPDAAARAAPGSRSDRPPARRSDRPPARRSDRPPSFKGRAAGRRR